MFQNWEAELVSFNLSAQTREHLRLQLVAKWMPRLLMSYLLSGIFGTLLY